MLTIHRADSSAGGLELERMAKDCTSIYKSPRRPTADDTLTLQKLAKSVKEKDPGAYDMAQEAIEASREIDEMLENHMKHLWALRRGEYEPVTNSESNRDDDRCDSPASVPNEYQCPDINPTADWPKEGVPRRDEAQYQYMQVGPGTESGGQSPGVATSTGYTKKGAGYVLRGQPMAPTTNQDFFFLSEASRSDPIPSGAARSDEQEFKDLYPNTSRLPETSESQSGKLSTVCSQPDHDYELLGNW